MEENRESGVGKEEEAILYEPSQWGFKELRA